MINIKEKLDLFGNQLNTKIDINRETLADALEKCLMNKSVGEMIGLLTTDYDCIFEYLNLYKGKRNMCNRMSLLFNPHRLYTNAKNMKTIFEAMKNKKWYSGLARLALSEFNGNGSTTFFHLLNMGIEATRFIEEFPPHISRMYAKQYGVTINSFVLDPCAGWGGRMIGISTICNNYQAYEPCTQTYNGLLKLSDFITKLRPEFKSNIKCLPFENALLPKNKFDFAITSPPYYDTELYSNEETQSYKKFNTFEKWIIGFYEPLIAKTMNALKPNASFILNIGSRKYPLEKELEKIIKKHNYKLQQIASPLSGKGGLRKAEGAEAFYRITK